MTNPTSNFGWQMPETTDLVTNLPADFEVFGQAVDTDFADLLGGTTGQVLKKNTNADLDFVWGADSAGMTNPMTTTGDIIYSSPGSTPVRLGIGSASQILTVASGVPSWATPAASGGMTLISTTSLSGSSTTVTIPGGYKDIFLMVYGITYNTSNSYVGVQINGAATNTYQVGVYGTTGLQGTTFVEAAERLFLAGSNQGGTLRTSAANGWSLEFYDYLQTDTYKSFIGTGSWLDTSSVIRMNTFGGQWRSTSAITTLVFETGQSGLAGTVKLWGVN